MASYFLFADVLGFTNLVANLNLTTLDKRIEEWQKLVDSIMVDTSVNYLFMISDSVLVKEDDTEEGLERLLSFSKLLLERGVDNFFPVRGAISKGDVSWGQTIYGKAVLDAIDLEKVQHWIGIACQPSLNIPWSWDTVCVYPVPKKTDDVMLMPALIWNMPPVGELMKKCTGQGFMKDGQTFKWDVLFKLKNTAEFGAYVTQAKAGGLNPAIYNSTVGPF